MLKRLLRFTTLLTLVLALCGCMESSKPQKIGISFGVGPAARWPAELQVMEEQAKALGLEVISSLNRTDKPKTQTQECFEMIDSGISVLILVPRDARRAEEILNYAKRKNVKVIAYTRAVMSDNVDLFVGYDCYRIGYTLAQHLTEKVYKGDVILLKGDANDFNTPLLYYGAMKIIQPFVDRGDFRVLLDDFVPDWSPKAAKEMVKKAVAANGNTIDAIYAPNDKLAEASAQALEELGVTTPVLITGMDAELGALRRIVAGKQDVTMFMDLTAMARTAVDEANNLVTKKKVNTNSQLDNSEGKAKIDAYLINGKLITKENIDKVLIEPGVCTKEDVYGPAK